MLKSYNNFRFFLAENEGGYFLCRGKGFRKEDESVSIETGPALYPGGEEPPGSCDRPWQTGGKGKVNIVGKKLKGAPTARERETIMN